jgi:inhibitor of nuclear factor kappa-B kinase subunit alpha
MPISDEDKALIKNLYQFKGYGARRLIAEFPEKNWSRGGLDYLISKIKATGSTDRIEGSGRPKTARTDDNVQAVEELVLSQPDRPQTHLSTREISMETGLTQSSVVRIIHQDLKLKCLKRRRAQELNVANRQSRLVRAKKLLQQYPADDVNFIWFTDEKIFSVAAPKNQQTNRLYVPETSRKRDVAADRLLSTRSTFSESIMVSVGVSQLGCTRLIFVDPGVKVNGEYYRDVVLPQLLTDMKNASGEYYIFQQDSAPAHRARDTIALLQRETPAFIPPDVWPPNSPDLNPVDYKIWSVMQHRVYRKKVQDVAELRGRLIEVWAGMEQTIIDDAIDQWRRRLRACVGAKGGHFEHSF